MNEFEDWCEVTPLGDLLVRAAALFPDRYAIIFPNARRTYAELLEGAIQVARGLSAIGVRRGEHIGLMMVNSADFIEGFFGVALLGCVVVPLNARHKASELGYIIKNAELVALLITADANEYVDFSEVLRRALPSLAEARSPIQLDLPEAPHLRSTILLRGENKCGFLGRPDFDLLAAQTAVGPVEAARRCVRVSDTAVILYTSGTTANPKGCMLSHEALSRGPVERARKRFAMSNHDVTWGAGPLFHIGSLAPFIGSVGAVGTYLTDTHFDAGRALELMTRERVTTAWPWFPAIVQGLLDHPSFDASRLASLRSIILIGPSSLIERVQSVFPAAEVLEACGMTETAGIYALSERGDTAVERATTQGKAVPGIEVRIVNFETGEDALSGEVGEILVRGYCVTDGYYHDAEKTSAALDADGWLHTGDLYSQTPNGHLVFHGRLKDMLKVGGENVAAIEVEAFLCGHPDVVLAEVVGMSDPRLDEVPVAFVELRIGSSLNEEALIEYCRGRIASFKIPRMVHFMAPGEWPMSSTKVDKRALRSRLLGHQSSKN